MLLLSGWAIIHACIRACVHACIRAYVHTCIRWVIHRSMANPNGDAMSVDMRDAKLTTTEAMELAQLLTDQPRLTAVDVRGNETMGLEGARALAGFIDSVCGRGVVGQQPRSLCGVTPGHSSLDVPKNLSPVDIRLVCAELSSHVFSEGAHMYVCVHACVHACMLVCISLHVFSEGAPSRPCAVPPPT